ncbi:hypothetical protein MAPG_07580 [Magnaporthiopsis poae ATCC 64411]|uniref:protein-ribulosamine 3-kinase n=1 Tax=Magnaporthiopsis poae (strain ATCC 64411 / 73-15) TaxID=644358 RepID=A0A0C4E522_MAGP6|nr:hypothetical protein MAPG_07580 [Magnaporthiopsis poae ATCC 64411]
MSATALGESSIESNQENGGVDPAIIKALPSVERVLDVIKLADSAWAAARRVIVRQTDGKQESYFVKVSLGHHGREALRGEYEATAAIHAITPGFCPKPIAWGTFQADDNSHFYMCKYYDLDPVARPPKESFCSNLARLHSSHTSPEGKFGFHCVTYNGNLPQDNTWCDKWEVFFARGLRHVLTVREERAGPDPQLNELLPALFDKVIPRLLRPLETGGRKVVPSLVHGDLWWGNASVDVATGEGIVYDPSSFWAHNECEGFFFSALFYLSFSDKANFWGY